jgi:hypothetical protein
MDSAPQTSVLLYAIIMPLALPTKELTVDGLEMQIGVNHFGMRE